MYGYHRDLHVLTLSFPTRRSSDLLNPRSDGICAMRDHEAIQSQNASIPCFFSRHSWLALLVSLMKNAESISTDFITCRNSACWPSSMWSFGAGVAVADRRKR